MSGSCSTPTTRSPSSIAYPTADDWALILRQRYGIARPFADEEDEFNKFVMGTQPMAWTPLGLFGE